MIVRRSLLKGGPDQAREQADAIAHALAPPHEFHAGRQLRALAVDLAGRGPLDVVFMSYEDGAQELEVSLTGDPRHIVITITRDKPGDQCQITWEQWAGIANPAEITEVADMITAVLSSGTGSNAGTVREGIGRKS